MHLAPSGLSGCFITEDKHRCLNFHLRDLPRSVLISVTKRWQHIVSFPFPSIPALRSWITLLAQFVGMPGSPEQSCWLRNTDERLRNTDEILCKINSLSPLNRNRTRSRSGDFVPLFQWQRDWLLEMWRRVKFQLSGVTSEGTCTYGA